MDFLCDQLLDGRKIGVLTIVDAFSKIAPAVDVSSAIPKRSSSRRWSALQRSTAPASNRVDNGPEFVSKDLDFWAYVNGVVLDTSRPGKPTDNSFVEAFNGKVRAECIDLNWFLTLEDANPNARHSDTTTMTSVRTRQSASKEIGASTF